MQGDKPFRTIDEQVEILRSRGLSVEDDDRLTLMREGYYSVVNGYKSAFIDPQRTSEAGDDRYREGTTFKHLALLFDYDRALREQAFPMLVRAETTVRTALAYSFSEQNRDHDAYLDPASYCERWQYHSKANYEHDLARLLRVLKRAHDNRWGQASIDHYLSSYGHVPLWVLVNVLTFGNVSHLYALSSPKVRNATCRMVSEAQGVGRIGSERLRSVVYTLVDFRNVCAHDDRLYCARLGMHNGRTFVDMLECLAMVLGEQEVRRYTRSVLNLLTIAGNTPDIQHELLSGMGIEISGGRIVRGA